jgi:bis(5'-nucleosyl)-tetraphosphatase (symmetrical)
VTRYAIGDVQGCYGPLRELLDALRFRSDRDQLHFAGDLVNRGPQSLEVLRFVRSLGANARVVLGNHDLHLLAHHFDPERPLRAGDTLTPVLAAKDREALTGWLLEQPLAIHDTRHNDLFVHAGLVPQWSAADATRNATSTAAALRADPRGFLSTMYGNKPDRWQPDLADAQRWRFTINVLTRLRYCRSDGRIDLKLKDAPDKVDPPWLPWFEHRERRSSTVRVIFGHWSTLGFVQRERLLALDTGCVWGGQLTAVNLDDPQAPPVQLPCKACQQPGSD